MPEKRKAKRLVIFNHKGGVGKTTLTVNIAFALASIGKKVLLVDSDPQCNLTSYLVADDVVDDLLDHSDEEKGETIWSALKPVSEGIGDIREIKPIQLENNNIYLLPGDIRLSEFETELTDFWSQCSLGKPKGYRGTTAISRLVSYIAEEVNADFVFYDAGPNIGPLNRVILLDCQYFIVPAACDLFSVRALKTLGNTLVTWIKEWQRILPLTPEEIEVFDGRPKLLGYIPEGFRVYGGKAASQHSHFIKRIGQQVHSELVVLLREIDKSLAPGRMSELKLGEIKDYATLVAASQQQGVPINEVERGDADQRHQAEKSFASIANKIIKRISTIDGSNE